MEMMSNYYGYGSDGIKIDYDMKYQERLYAAEIAVDTEDER
ncbi:MAG: hypothetical protein WC616_01445 [Candidatus Omnitrophota bacterium]